MIDNYTMGKYNMALVQCAILFENFVYKKVDATNKLSNTKKDKLKKNPDCGCLVGISEFCKRVFKEYFNFDFEQTKEWDNLKTDLIKIRNKIVHGEIIEELTEEQCRKALDASEAAQCLLEKEVFNY